MTESFRFSGESSPVEAVFDEAETATRSQKRAMRTRRKLLAASLALFSERGVDSTTIEDITEQADLGKGTFYRHFSNKEELAETLIDSILSKLIQLLHGGKKPLANLKEALERIFDVHVRFFTRQQNATLLLFDWLIKLHLRDADPGALRARFDEYRDAIGALLKPFLPEQAAPEALRMLAAGAGGLVPGVYSFAWFGLPHDQRAKLVPPLRRAFVAAATSWLSDRTFNHKVSKSTELA